MTTVAFVSPRAAISSTHGKVTKWPISAAGSAAVAITSRSRNVSRPRRTLPGPRDLDRRRMLAQRLDDLAHDREPDAEEAAPLGLGPKALVERGEDLLLTLRPETLERPHPLLLGRFAQLVEGRHVELAPDARRRLGAEPRDPQELRHLARHLGPSLLERGHVAGLRQLDDLRLDRPSDPGELLRPTGEGELRDRRSRLAHPGRGSAVGDDTEALLSEDLRDVRELVERVCDVAVAWEGRHPPIIRTHRSRSETADSGRGCEGSRLRADLRRA